MQRSGIETELASRRRELDPATESTAQYRAVLFGTILLGYPNQHGALSARSRSEIYREATDDCPAWAIAGAMQKWASGLCGEHHNYDFAPNPAVLRIWAKREMEPYAEAVHRLEILLIAKPLEKIMPLPDWEDRRRHAEDAIKRWPGPAPGHAARALADLALRAGRVE